jgi:hypothetical protein
MSLGTEPGIRTRDLPPDATLENQALGSLSFEYTTEGQTESLSDEDTRGQSQGSTDEDQESTTQESTTRSSLDDIPEGPVGSDSDDDSLFALDSSDEGLNKGRDEGLELDYEAFRTITSLLALTQAWPDLRRSNRGGPKPASTRKERLVLNICNSLAVLAVIEHEVIAIGVDFQLASVEVTISASVPEQEDSEGSLNGLTKLGLLVHKNPRRSEYKRMSELTEDQLTMKPLIPTSLKEFALREFALREFAEEDLTSDIFDRYITSLNVTRLVPLVPTHVLCLHGQNRDNPTLEEHIWMLLRIFNTWKTPNDLKHPALAICYYVILSQDVEAHQSSQVPSTISRVFRGVNVSNITFSGSKEPKATERETQHDREFLDLFREDSRKMASKILPTLPHA